MRFSPHGPKPRGAFERMTIAHLGTCHADIFNENGYHIDEMNDAGPMVLDYSSALTNFGPGNPGTGDYDLSSSDATLGDLKKYRSREYSFVLCDGRNMGPDNTDEFPGGASSSIPTRTWDDCEYVVLRNIRYKLVFATPRAENCYVYYKTITDADTHMTPGIESVVAFPMADELTLKGVIDSMTIGAIEAEGGDFWWHYCEMLLAPLSVTLMRADVSENDDLTTDITLMDDINTRSTLTCAPLGMLMAEEIDDLDLYYGANAFDPTSQYCFPLFRDLQGIPRLNLDHDDDLVGLNPTDGMYERVFRAWEPMDKATNILQRTFIFARMQSTANQGANSRWELDSDGVEGLEPTGVATLPRWTTTPTTITIEGEFRGEVVVSARDPRPLILHIASLPVCIHTYVDDVTGLPKSDFYRAVLSPLSWMITADVKAA